jgi:peptidoglycan-N-acetylglucosamine deacetylase
MSNHSSHSIALSFDIEDWYHTPLISGSSFSKYTTLDDFLNHNKQEYLDCISDETLRIIEILDHYKISATFFLVADVAQRYHGITEALKGSRHEIASHSLTHRSGIDAKTRQPLVSEDDWYNEQVEAKKLLEMIFGVDIIGFRAPNAVLANWMIPLLEKTGFKYDSSVAFNSLYNKTNVKLKNIPSQPYFINADDLSSRKPSTRLMELPWSNCKITPFVTLPAGGGYFFRLLGYSYFKRVLQKTLKKSDSMFYMHPLDISRKRIPSENPRNRPLYWINKGEKTEKNLINLLKEFKGKFTTCKEVYFKNLDK